MDASTVCVNLKWLTKAWEYDEISTKDEAGDVSDVEVKNVEMLKYEWKRLKLWRKNECEGELCWPIAVEKVYEKLSWFERI